jgi:hypothetical protein
MRTIPAKSIEEQPITVQEALDYLATQQMLHQLDVDRVSMRIADLEVEDPLVKPYRQEMRDSARDQAVVQFISNWMASALVKIEGDNKAAAGLGAAMHAINQPQPKPRPKWEDRLVAAVKWWFRWGGK